MILQSKLADQSPSFPTARAEMPEPREWPVRLGGEPVKVFTIIINLHFGSITQAITMNVKEGAAQQSFLILANATRQLCEVLS